MAGKIAGITVQIGGETSGLQNALTKLNAKVKPIETELRSVNTLLKLDPRNTVALAQKQMLLKNAIDETKKKLQALKNAQAEADKTIADGGEVNQEGYRKLQREIEFTSRKLDKYEDELGQTEQAAKAAAEGTGKLGDEAKKAEPKVKELGEGSKASLKGIAIAAAAVVAGVAAIGKKAVDISGELASHADEINTLSAKYRVSTESLQKFAYASNIVDVSVETFGGSLGKLTRAIRSADKGVNDQSKAFQALGVSVKDTNGEYRDSEDVFWDVIDALGDVENETEADIYANALFSRSFQELNPLIAAGSEQLKELGQEAENVGAVLSDKELKTLNDYQDMLDKLGYQAKIAAAPFVEGLAPALTETGKAMSKTLGASGTQALLKRLGNDAGRFVGKAAETFLNFSETVLSDGDHIISMLKGVAAGFAAFKTITFIQDRIKDISSLSAALQSFSQGGLIGLAVAGIAAITVGVVDAANSMSWLSDEAKNVVSSTENLQKSISASNQTFSDSISEIESNALEAETLTNRLDELANKTNLSAQEQAEMQLIVSSLNNLYPDLGLSIDSTSGSINKSTAEIRKNVSAMQAQAKAAAYQKRLEELYGELADAQINAAKAANERKKAERDAEIASARLTNATSVQTDVIYEAQTALTSANMAISDLTENEQKNNDIASEVQTQIDMLIGTYTGYATSATTAAESVGAVTDAESANAAQREEIAEQQAALLEEQKKILEDRLSQTQDIFSKIDTSVDVSVQSMIDNLTENQTVVSEWAENLGKLSGRIDETLLQALRDAGPAAAKSVQNLVNASDDELDELNSVFKNGSKVAVDAMKTELGLPTTTDAGSNMIDNVAAGVQNNNALDTASSKAVVRAKQTINSTVTTSDFRGVGSKIVTEIAAGITNNLDKIGTAANKAATRFKNNFRVSGYVTTTPTGGVKYNWYAKGGIFNNPSVIGVGEAGQEAVLPIEKLSGIMADAMKQLRTTKNGTPAIGGVNQTFAFYTPVQSPSQTAAAVKRTMRGMLYGL